MKRLHLGSLVVAAALCVVSGAQTQPVPASSSSGVSTECPEDRAGIFVQTASWQEMNSQLPARTKAKHGIAASLSYGVVPAKIVSEYVGEHAATKVKTGPVTICICRLLSLPGKPAIVKLHSRKNVRELDGGKMIVYPVIGGSGTADANKSDLMAVDVAHADAHAWLVKSQSSLAPGEYALMLGTQNVNIYPFTVEAAVESSAEKK